MSQDNTNRGFGVSLSLHAFALFCFVLSMYVGDFFKEEVQEKLVFDMVEPPPPELQTLEDASMDEPESQQIETPKVKEIEPIKLPEPEPKVEPKPDPDPMPNPQKEKLKPDKPKKTEPKKVEQPPQKISLKDFRKNNPLKDAPKKPAKKRGIKVPKITNYGTNIDKYRESPNIGTATIDGVKLENAIMAYIESIKAEAKRKWSLPVECTGMNFSVKIAFKVSSAGVISGVRIIRSSGSTPFDNSVVEVFKRLRLPFPPPNNQPQTINLVFESI